MSEAASVRNFLVRGALMGMFVSCLVAGAWGFGFMPSVPQPSLLLAVTVVAGGGLTWAVLMSVWLEFLATGNKSPVGAHRFDSRLPRGARASIVISVVLQLAALVAAFATPDRWFLWWTAAMAGVNLALHVHARSLRRGRKPA